MTGKPKQSLRKRPAAAPNTKTCGWSKEKQLQSQRESKRKRKEAAEKKIENNAKYNATKASRNGGTYNAGERTGGDLGKRIQAAAAVAAAAAMKPVMEQTHALVSRCNFIKGALQDGTSLKMLIYKLVHERRAP